jgi:hypothetical protein
MYEQTVIPKSPDRTKLVKNSSQESYHSIIVDKIERAVDEA